MRRSRTYRRMGATPKFIAGDKIGNFKILYYIGYSSVNPVKATFLSKEHHWYKCECTCKNREVRTQQQLIDTRRQQQCSACTKDPFLPLSEKHNAN